MAAKTTTSKGRKATTSKARKPRKGSKPAESAKDLQSKLTARFIEALETGDAGTWRKPWTTAFAFGVPYNATTGLNYKGGNIWAFALEVYDREVEGAGFATYNQWKNVGCQVRKGAKSIGGVKWNVKRPCKGEPEGHRCDKCSGMFPTTFRVFHQSDVDGADEYIAKRYNLAKVEGPEAIEAAETFIANTGADVRHLAGDRAFYSPLGDYVTLPKLEQFESAERYYATALHELVHWTGHRSRLDRFKPGVTFGDPDYAYEELIAELGSVFVCAGSFGFDIPERDDHAAYVASWVKALKAAPTILWKAATAASKAAEHLDSLQPAEEVLEAA